MQAIDHITKWIFTLRCIRGSLSEHFLRYLIFLEIQMKAGKKWGGQRMLFKRVSLPTCDKYSPPRSQPSLKPRMKITVFTNLLVTWFYGYIEIYHEILVDIFIQNIDGVKILKTHENVGKLLRNDIKSNNTYIIIEIWRNWYRNDLIYDIL